MEENKTEDNFGAGVALGFFITLVIVSFALFIYHEADVDSRLRTLENKDFPYHITGINN